MWLERFICSGIIHSSTNCLGGCKIKELIESASKVNKLLSCNESNLCFEIVCTKSKWIATKRLSPGQIILCIICHLQTFTFTPLSYICEWDQSDVGPSPASKWRVGAWTNSLVGGKSMLRSSGHFHDLPWAIFSFARAYPITCACVPNSVRARVPYSTRACPIANAP
jgi:hypothetical protein